MARDEHYTPFEGKRVTTAPPMRVIRRFTKANGAVAEIRERKVTQFAALEWMLFVDGSLIESRARAPLYVGELEERCGLLVCDGWNEGDPVDTKAQ